MEDFTPRIEQQDTPQGRLFVVQGAWTAAGLTGEAVWEALTAQLQSRIPADAESRGIVTELHVIVAGTPWEPASAAAPERIDFPLETVYLLGRE
jgi:hypothetical protein